MNEKEANELLAKALLLIGRQVAAFERSAVALERCAAAILSHSPAKKRGKK